VQFDPLGSEGSAAGLECASCRIRQRLLVGLELLALGRDPRGQQSAGKPAHSKDDCPTLVELHPVLTALRKVLVRSPA
jgi:hypothetical protein